MAIKRPKRKMPADELAVAAAVLMTVALSLPVWPLAAQNMAVAAVAAALPEGGLAQLKQRFAPEAQTEEIPQEIPQTPQPPVRQEPSPPQQEEAEAQQKEDEPIPEEFRGTLLHETFGVQDESGWLNLGVGWLRNYTALGFDDIEQAIVQTQLLQLKQTDEPQVLILHTHATESYETHSGQYYDTRSSWRTQNDEENMCAIGEIVAEQLRKAGIGVVHDTTQHDHPSYNGSYDRSRATVESVMEEYPDIQVVLDIHRDAIQRDQTTVVAPVTRIEGKSCAQVMIIAGCDDGSLNMPNWRQNLRFGAELQNRLEEDWPTLTRPLFFAHRKYNQDMAPGALLIEIGASGNTFEEAAYAAQLTGSTLAGLLIEMEEAH